jgi:hypothetical protein
VNCVNHFSSLVIFIHICDVLIILHLCLYSIWFICHLASLCESGESLFLVSVCVCVPCELKYYPLLSSLSFLHADPILLSRNHTTFVLIAHHSSCHSYLITLIHDCIQQSGYNFLQVPISRNSGFYQSP